MATLERTSAVCELFIELLNPVVPAAMALSAACVCATLSDFTGYEDADKSDLVAPRTLARWWRGCGG
jgi:hypothetical protein